LSQLSRKQCADLLGISLSTFQRRVKAGKYGAGTKTGPLKTDEVWYTFPDIGLPEPTREEVPRALPEPVVTPEPKSEEVPRSSPEPEPVVTREPSDFELRQQADLAFAEAYRRGDVTDSMGNTVNGSNEKYPVSGLVTVLGPKPVALPPLGPRTGTRHMDPALLSDTPTDRPLRNPQLGDGSTQQGSPLGAGYTQEQYDADMQDWRRRRGLPSMSQQREAIERSEALIHAAFPRG
jgi:hypothetical protein